MELLQFGEEGGKLETDSGEGPKKAVCLLGSLFTFLRVILAPRGEQSRGADKSLGLVSGRRASRRSGGTWTCGWYIKTHTYTQRHRPPADRPLELLHVFVPLFYIIFYIISLVTFQLDWTTKERHKLMRRPHGKLHKCGCSLANRPTTEQH